MRQRVTYLLPNGTDIRRSDILNGEHGIDYMYDKLATEEWQVKLGLHELPDELRAILEGSQELHLRWSWPWLQPNQTFFSPLVSRIPPGLHTFFNPRQGVDEVPVCSLLQRITVLSPIKCTSVYETFAKIYISSEHSGQTSIFQWHSNRHIDPEELGETVLGKVCPGDTLNEKYVDACTGLIQDLNHASQIDVDYDATSDVLTFAAHWPQYDERYVGRDYRKAEPEDRLEIGVLHAESSKKPEELIISGFLTLDGENERPSATYFSFPSRHHPLPSNTPATFITSFQHPTGLHPKLQITLPAQHLRPPQDSCTLHAYLTLPSALFIDRFQLADHIFLSSQNLISLNSLAGAHDLEAPDWVTPLWGSASLLQLAVPPTPGSMKGKDWTVTIPMHLRYIDKPREYYDGDNEATVETPWPVVFWACKVDEDVKLYNNPFDRINLGYDGLFPSKTVFYHIPPAAVNESRAMIEKIKVPILNADNTEMVQVGTLIAVAVGFAWVCWKLLSVAMSGSGREDGKEKKSQ